jgi:hypothetical protein
MNFKNFFLIFISGLFLFLFLPNVVEAACGLMCCPCYQGQLCIWDYDPGFVDYAAYTCERIGLIGSTQQDYCIPANCSTTSTECSNSGGTQKCGCGYFLPGTNGQNCYAKDGCWSWGCDYITATGKWDAYESQCVSCNGYKENRIWGDTTDVYFGCGSEDGNAGDGLCESACGAATACDEFSPGQQGNCPSGQKCNNSCQCETVCDCTSTTPGGCCDGCYFAPAGKVYGGGGSGNWVDATATTKCAATANKCTNGNCSGEKRYPECRVGGTCDSSATTYYTSDPVYASAGKVLTSTCGNQDATADVKCASTVNKCTAGNCSGEKRYPECQSGGTCDSSATTYYTSDPVYASAGKVLTSTCTNQDATSSIKCAATVNKCTTGQCLGEKRYPECQAGGTCDSSAATYYTPETVYASAGYSLTSACGTTGTTLCDSTWRASSGTGDNHYGKGGAYTCQGMCNGTGSCEYAVNCGVCTGSLTVSISGTGTCTVTASFTVSNCNGQTWQVRDDGTTKCSGTVSGSPYSYTCSNWTVGVGSYTYNLYVGGELKDSKSVSCSATPFDFSISINPTSGSTTQGNSISSTVTVTLISGDTQAVTFTASNLPSGASASFNPASCSPTCTSTMTIDTSETTPADTYSINVCGTGGGQNRCVTYELTVTEAGVGINPPSVTTNEATNVAQASATLNGTLNDMGGATSCLVWFEWGATTSYGNSTSVQTITAPGSFSANISGLDPETTYYFEAFAKNAGSW